MQGRGGSMLGVSDFPLSQRTAHAGKALAQHWIFAVQAAPAPQKPLNSVVMFTPKNRIENAYKNIQHDLVL